MRVLFLDFDGVLNSRRYPAWVYPGGPYEAKQRGLAPEHVGHLNRVLSMTGAKVVISSSWRYMHEVETIDALLRAAGFNGEIVGFTPRKLSDRGAQIQAWLDEETRPVESFAIVDDCADMAHLLPYLVQTDDDDGLERQHADRLVALLATPGAASGE